MKQFWLGFAASTLLYGSFHLGKWVAFGEIEALSVEISEPTFQAKSTIQIPEVDVTESYVSPRTARTELCDTRTEKRKLGDYIQVCLHNGNNPDSCLSTGSVISCRNEKLKKENSHG